MIAKEKAVFNLCSTVFQIGNFHSVLRVELCRQGTNRLLDLRLQHMFKSFYLTVKA